MSSSDDPRARLVLVSSNDARASMTPMFEKSPDTRLEQVRYALLCARTARDWLRAAGADNAADYMARAIKSVEGAERHALRLETERQ